MRFTFFYKRWRLLAVFLVFVNSPCSITAVLIRVLPYPPQAVLFKLFNLRSLVSYAMIWAVPMIKSSVMYAHMGPALLKY